MDDCHQIEPLLTERLFGEPTDEERTALDAHLAQCATCTTLLRDMESTLRVASLRRPVDPGAEYWDGFADRMEARIRADDGPVVRVEPSMQTGHSENDPRPMTVSDGNAVTGEPMRRVSDRDATRGLRRHFATSRPVSWAAAVAFVAIGVLLGRVLFAPSSPQAPMAEGPRVTDPPNERQIVLARTQAYLDRSKMLLLELAHFDAQTDDPVTLNLPRRSQIAQELVLEAADLDVALAAAREKRLRSLVADLEEILTQIADLEAQSESPAIEMVRSGVDEKALMFRIDVEELRAIGAAPGPNRRDTESAPGRNRRDTKSGQAGTST